MKVTVKVDDKRCIGSGSCLVIATEYFDLNDEGKAVVKPSKRAKQFEKELTLEVSASQKNKLLEAARVCPTLAISVFDEQGKKISA